MSQVMPIECPKCEERFLVEDYYEVSEGSEIECPFCEATIVCTEEEHVTWEVKP